MGIEEPSRIQQETRLPLDLMAEKFADRVLEAHLSHGDAEAVIRPEALMEVMEFLKGDERLLFDMLLDVTAVDFPARDPRFDVVYHLLSLRFNRRLRVKVRVRGDNPELPSLTPLWGNADWLEREVWDMFGIRFAGHPGLKRILLYEEFQGHPLRKDYPIRRRQPLIGPKN